MIASHSERKQLKSVREIVVADDIVAKRSKVHANFKIIRAVEQRYTAADQACALLFLVKLHVEQSANFGCCNR